MWWPNAYDVHEKLQKQLLNLCIFDIFDRIIGCCDEIPRVSFQPNGSVFVQMGTPEQSVLLKKLNMIADTRILHQGISILQRPLELFRKEIIKKLFNQGIVRSKKIKKKADGVLITPSPISNHLFQSSNVNTFAENGVALASSLFIHPPLATFSMPILWSREQELQISARVKVQHTAQNVQHKPQNVPNVEAHTLIRLKHAIHTYSRKRQ